MAFLVTFTILQLIHIFLLSRIKRKIISYQQHELDNNKAKKRLASLLTLDTLIFVIALFCLVCYIVFDQQGKFVTEINPLTYLLIFVVIVFNTILLLRLRTIPKTLQATFQRQNAASYL